jgi:hypothetical protein
MSTNIDCIQVNTEMINVQIDSEDCCNWSIELSQDGSDKSELHVGKALSFRLVINCPTRIVILLRDAPELITMFHADSYDNTNLESGKKRVHKCVLVVRRREIR